MARKNPFTKAVADTASSKTAEVEEAGADLRRRLSDDELKQADNDGGSNSDVPSSVTDNADAEEDVGKEFGLGSVQFESAKDRAGGTDVTPEAEEDRDQIQTPEERIAAQQGVIPQYNIDGMSTQDALAAASGADNTDVSNLVSDPRGFVDAAKEERNPLNDPQIAGAMALVDEAENSAATNPYSAAQGSDDLAKAVAEVYGTPPADPDAGKAKEVDVVTKGGGGKPAGNAAYWDDEKGEVVYPDQVTDKAKADAEKDMTTTRDHNKTTEGDEKSTGTGLLGMIGEYFADEDYKEEWGETEKKAAELHAARQAKDAASGGSTGASGSGAGGGAKLVDPNNDNAPPTEAEIAFAQSMKQQLGIRRIPGDIDPTEGDGTQTTGPVNEQLAGAIVGTKTNESLVGNPTGATAGPVGTPGQGNPGFGGSDKGGDIDFEDGSGFTGGVRTTGPQDVEFGVGSQPLIGFDDEADEEDEADDEDEDTGDEDDAQGGGS